MSTLKYWLPTKKDYWSEFDTQNFLTTELKNRVKLPDHSQIQLDQKECDINYFDAQPGINDLTIPNRYCKNLH